MKPRSRTLSRIYVFILCKQNLLVPHLLRSPVPHTPLTFVP